MRRQFIFNALSAVPQLHKHQGQKAEAGKDRTEKVLFFLRKRVVHKETKK